jgi:hypothetical protein
MPEVTDLPEVTEAAPFEDETLPEDESFDFAARFAAVTAAAAVTDETPDAEPLAVEPPAAEPPVLETVAEPEVADATSDGLDHPAAGAAAAAAAAAAAKTSDLFQRFRPGQSLDDEIEAFERAQEAEVAAKAAAATAALHEPQEIAPEPAAPAAAAPEPVYPEPEPAPVETFEPEPVAAVEPSPAPAWPEPVAAEPAAAEPTPFPAGDPRVDHVPQPTWQIVAPDAPPTNGVPQAPVQQPSTPPADAIAATSEPQWPDRDAAAGLPFLGRPAVATGGIDALWAASAHEVATVSQVPQFGIEAPKAAGGVQPCVSCGLSLSANARFCRRCGTRQG